MKVPGVCWCDKHARWESVDQYASEKTAEYIERHPEMIDTIFGDQPS